MWSIFSRDPTKDFAYEIGDKIPGLEDQSIWSLHSGKRKTDGEEMTIFVFDVKGSSESQIALAKSSFKKIKTLRHPNILTFVDGLESEKVIYIVTEHVIPLETYLQQNDTKGKQNELAISWGLHQIVKGQSFLTNDCNFIHNNICMASVFVDKAGEWKLSGVDYMYPASGPDCIPPVKILPALEKYDPPEKASGGRKATEKWSADMWGLGCLIWEVFNGSLPKTNALKTPGKIPKSLIPNYCELVSANPRSRPNPAKLIDMATSRQGFMDNKFVQTMLFLEEIQIKDASDKNNFFNTLAPVLDDFPDAFCRHKILPQLIHAFEYGNAGSGILTPLFKLGKLLDSEEYQKKIVPCVVKLFSSTDRSTRVKLLQQMDLFVEHLTPQVVNEQIYPNVVTGFMDSNPVVREHTIKSMLQLACKLNYKNLNDDLLKHFARLQSKDDQGGIRTNTTVCLGKIACHLNPQTRQKILPSAYMRAVKDPFPPARQAGILAMAANHNFFTLRDGANRLLPTLCSLTMDPDKGVRDQTFRAIKCFMGKLEKVSENPELMAEMEKDVNIGGSVASSAAGWAGWAVSGMTSLTSKIYKGKGPAPAGATSSNVGELSSKPSSREQSKEPSPPKSSGITKQKETTNKPTPAKVEEPDEPAESWNENDGWEDDDHWGDMEDTSQRMSTLDVAEDKEDGDGWEDEDWGSLEDTGANTKNSSSGVGDISIKSKKESSPWGAADFTVEETPSTTSSYNWDDPAGTGSDFFSQAAKGKPKPGIKKTRPTSASSTASSSSLTKTKTSTEKTQLQSRTSPSKSSASGGGWEDSGWDDNNSPGWGEEDWQSMDDDQGLNKADLAKKKREEKRLQRQKEIEEKRAARQAGGGAMKLGAKKFARE